MKKLLFATALVASAAAFADGEPTALNAISFEGYSAGATLVNGEGEQEEAGGDKTYNYFCYIGDADGSSVKAFGGENVAAPDITRPFYFASAQTNAKYLDLSTEGGVLWRSINAVSGSGTSCALGSEQEVGSGGLFLDTLVQFTPTEDGGTPELTTGVDKLAIWLNVDTSVTPSVTNLMVQANLYDFGEAPSATPTTFTLVASNNLTTVVAGQWYRLTVKAIPNVMNTDENGVIPAFEIYIDGVPMYATTAQFTSGMVTTLTGMNALSEAAAAAIAANKLFPSLAQMGNQGDTPTLQAVGFKGSGALDDIVWTTEDPFANAPGPAAEYQVTINDSPVPVTPTADDLAAVQAAVVAGGGTLDVTDVAAVNAALAAPIGSTSIPSWQALFLGLPPTEAGLESFKIDSISFNEDGNVVVTLPSTVDPKTGRGVNITIKLQSADTPDATSWTDVESATGTTFAPVTPGSTDTKKFYKVVVEFAASSAQSN